MLTVTQEGSVAILQWETPTVDYDSSVNSVIMLCIYIPGIPSQPQSPTLTQEGSVAVLQWKAPTGDYDSAGIRQCQVATDICTDRNVPKGATILRVAADPQKEYKYSLLLYQEGIVVAESKQEVMDKGGRHVYIMIE